MKKIFMILALMFACTITLNVFNVPTITTAIAASRTVSAELTDSNSGSKLFLYQDGSCVLRNADNSRVAGRYSIEGTKIFFTWDSGMQQQGWCRFVEGKITTVSVEGYTFTQRIVRSRR